MLFILLGNIASSLKFELISHKIGLVFFVMELDTHELFGCLARNCNYRDEIQKRTALYETKGAYHLTENFGNSRWKENGKVTFRKFQPKIEEYVLR